MDIAFPINCVVQVSGTVLRCLDRYCSVRTLVLLLRRVLDRIEAVNYDVLSHRPTIGATDVAWLVGATIGWPRSIQTHAAAP